MGRLPSTSRPNAWHRKSPLSAIISETPIAIKAITTAPALNFVNCFVWIPVGSAVTAVWLERLCPRRDYESAIVELKLAILQNPSSADEHRYLGQALLLVHRQADAIRELRLAVQLDPDSPLAHHYLATALFNGEDFAAAETEFRQALRLQPSAGNHYYLSACLMSLGRYDAALAELETAARLEPAEDLYRTRKQELLKLMKASNVR